MPSAIDITKPIYGTPTTQSVRDNFHIARDEITDLQNSATSHVNRAGDTMTGPLILYGDPYAQNEATTLKWVLQQLHSTVNTLIYIGEYDGATDRILSSGQPQFIVGQPLPPASAATSQYYFTVKTGHASPGIGNQPAEGVTAGTFLISNGVKWINYAMTAANITAKTTPIDDPPIPNVPGANVYDALAGIGQNFLMKSGGTLTNFLTLHAAPTANFHAATKKYTDDLVANLSFPSEAPVDAFHYARGNRAWINTPTFSKMVLNTNTWGHITLNSTTASNTANQIIAQKDGLNRWAINIGNNVAAHDFEIWRYNDLGTAYDTLPMFQLQRSSGNATFRHALFIDPPIAEGNVIYGRGANNPTDPQNDTFSINARSGGINSSAIGLRGPTFPNAADSIQLYAGVNWAKVWSFYYNGDLSIPGNINFPIGGLLNWGGGTVITKDGGNNLLFYGNSSYRMYWDFAGGYWYWQGPPNFANKMYLTSNGELFTAGYINVGTGLRFAQRGAGNSFSFGWSGAWVQAYVDNTYQYDMASTAWVNANFYTYHSSPEFVATTVVGQLRVTANIMNTTGTFYVADNYAYYLSRNSANGIWYFVENGTVNFRIEPNGNIYATASVNAATHMSCQSVGIQYPNVSSTSGFNFRWDGSNILGRVDNAVELPISNYPSDERIKAEIAPSKFDCLEAIRKTPLFQFRFRKGRGGEHSSEIFTAEPQQGLPIIPIGFVAQKQYEVFPESVMKGDDEMGAGPEGSTQLWTMNNNTLIATLYGAVKELVARIEVLETALAPGVKP